MKKKVLILEDNLYTAEDIETEISFKFSDNNDVEILIANSLDEANDMLSNIDKEEIVCIIADLNMDPSGLSHEEKIMTFGAVLTGWVWVSSKIMNDTELKDKNIIFYSAFINRLVENSTYKELTREKKRKIKLINKNEHGLDELCDALIKII